MAATRRLIRITSGLGLIVAGVAMLVLPGPGILTILVGSALLSGDTARGSISTDSSSLPSVDNLPKSAI